MIHNIVYWNYKWVKAVVFGSLQLSVQSVPITTKVVSSNPARVNITEKLLAGR
jgi:hypothetical protein